MRTGGAQPQKSAGRQKELQGRIVQSRENLARFTEEFIAECEKEAENIDTAIAAERQKPRAGNAKNRRQPIPNLKKPARLSANTKRR